MEASRGPAARARSGGRGRRRAALRADTRSSVTGLSGPPANVLQAMKKLLQTRTALITVCVARAGFRGGGELVEFVDDWAACVTGHDGPVGVEAYAKWTRRYSYRTAYNRLSLFRSTFPELGAQGTPEQLLGPLVERLAREVGDG